MFTAVTVMGEHRAVESPRSPSPRRARRRAALAAVRGDTTARGAAARAPKACGSREECRWLHEQLRACLDDPAAADEGLGAGGGGAVEQRRQRAASGGGGAAPQRGRVPRTWQRTVVRARRRPATADRSAVGRRRAGGLRRPVAPPALRGYEHQGTLRPQLADALERGAAQRLDNHALRARVARAEAAARRRSQRRRRSSPGSSGSAGRRAAASRGTRGGARGRARQDGGSGANLRRHSARRPPRRARCRLRTGCAPLTRCGCATWRQCSDWSSSSENSHHR